MSRHRPFSDVGYRVVKQRKLARWCAMILISGLFVVGQPASAGVVLNGTRFIYPAKSKEITVRLTNEGAQSVLVQAWVDDGDAKQLPENTQAPFDLTPPVFRMDSKKSQVLRVRFSGADLPADRESLYWLNVLEVPPKPAVKDDDNYMQLAFRYRLKLIYRPKGLSGSADAACRFGRRLVYVRPGATLAYVGDVLLGQSITCREIDAAVRAGAYGPHDFRCYALVRFAAARADTLRLDARSRSKMAP